MNKTFNADIMHVAEAVELLKEQEEVTIDDPIKIQVWGKDVVMFGITNEEMDDRNIPRDDYEDLVCTIEIHTANQLKLKFHEKVVENEFSLNPVGPHAIDPQQATQPQELGVALKMVVDQLNYAYDIYTWDFVKVDGASIAHGGYICDYEFEYEAFMN